MSRDVYNAKLRAAARADVEGMSDLAESIRYQASEAFEDYAQTQRLSRIVSQLLNKK